MLVSFLIELSEVKTMPTAFGFRPYTNRNIIRSGLSVCTSVVYNTIGEFKPIAFGMEMNGMRYRYRIKSVKVVKESPSEYIFDCEYVDLGRIKVVRLILDINRCLWYVE